MEQETGDREYGAGIRGSTHSVGSKEQEPGSGEKGNDKLI